MQTEIEAKFLDIDHEDIRNKLKALGAVCEQPMRLMRRVMLDHPDGRYQMGHLAERLRIRDEGDKVTVTYKASNDSNYPDEIEIQVDSFENTRKLFEAIGFCEFSFQESKREAWLLNEVEIVLDEWPWLKPYIEIEGPSESAIQAVAAKLGFSWEQARFGSVDAAYMAEYPKMTEEDTIGMVPNVSFDTVLPDYLKERL